MANMHPNNLNPLLFTTESERVFYEKLRDNLSDDYHVFYSVVWHLYENKQRVNGECDFLIYHPAFGYIVIEVKGGIKIEVNDGWWKIYDGRNRVRELKRSPYKQSQESMYFFKKYYERTYAERYNGIYGSAIALPFYKLDENIDMAGNENITITNSDLKNIGNKINNIFHYWAGKRKISMGMPTNQKKKFYDLLCRQICLSNSKSSINQRQIRKMDILNQLQDEYWKFIHHYKKAFITGNAGTGKTYMLMRKAKELADKGASVLITTYSEELAYFIYSYVDDNRIDIQSVGELDINTKYDAILVDEAQDLSISQCNYISNMMIDKENSYLYVFYDEGQNIYNEALGDKFQINTLPFVLTKNLRNTTKIWNYVIEKTGLGKESTVSGIYGVEPIQYKYITTTKTLSMLWNIIDNFISNEGFEYYHITILSDVIYENSIIFDNSIRSEYHVVNKRFNELKENEISYRTIAEFKGLENDIIIFLNHRECNKLEKFVAYSRARFFLYEMFSA